MGAFSVGMVRFPSGWCIFRRDGAFSVGMVRFPSGWCIFRRDNAFSKIHARADALAYKY